MKVKKHLSFGAMRKKLSDMFNKIPDHRSENRIEYPLHDVLMSGFACMHFQDPSLLQFQQRLEKDQHRNNLQTLFGVATIPKETQMREIIDEVDSDHLVSFFKEIILSLQRGKYLEPYQLLPGQHYFPLDGSEIYSSGEVNCEQCLHKKHLNGVELKIKKDITEQQLEKELLACREETGKKKQLRILKLKNSSLWQFYEKRHSEDDASWALKSVEPNSDLGKELAQLDTVRLNKEKTKVLIKAAEKTLGREYGSTVYSHQVLQGAIAHPDLPQVIPFAPEEISNHDGADKQDCEMNAAKRYIKKIRAAHPQLGLIIGGDALFSRQPLIEQIVVQRFHYIFVAKPDDHKYLMDWVAGYKTLDSIEFRDKKGRLHVYEWVNSVPLSGREDSVNVNFFRCKVIKTDEDGSKRIAYKNSWVTDIEIDKNNIKKLVSGGRCRWKSENELFNTMKNHGYYMDRNYGHGKKNLCFNFYILTLMAFLFHQVFELTDNMYQACRGKFGSKKHMWETLRAYIKIIVFDSWDGLLRFAFDPEAYQVTLGASP